MQDAKISRLTLVQEVLDIFHPTEGVIVRENTTKSIDLLLELGPNVGASGQDEEGV